MDTGVTWDTQRHLPSSSPPSQEFFGEVKRAVAAISELSFVDDIGWWVEGEDDKVVAAKLSEAAAASIEWAPENWVAFDYRKMEAVIFCKKGMVPQANVTVGDNKIPFNKEVTRWLGVWLNSLLKLQNQHAVRMKEGRKALTQLRRLTGQMGISAENCRKGMTAYIQSTAMYSEHFGGRESTEEQPVWKMSCRYWSTNRLGQQPAASE